MDARARTQPRTSIRVGVVMLVLAFSLGAWAPAASAAHGTAEDQKAAEAGLLTQDDFTSDWTEQPSTTDSVKQFQQAVAAGGAACKVMNTALKTAATAPHATSSAFTSATSTAQNSVVVFANPTAADTAMTAFKSAAMRNCLAKVLPKTLPALLSANPDVGKVTSVTVTVKPGTTAAVASASANWESTVKAKLKSGKTITMSVNTEAVADDRAFSMFQFANKGTQQLDGIHDHLIASSIGRTEGAIGTNALGETPELAAALLPVPGYSYSEATATQQLKITAMVNDPDNTGIVLGQSVHSVLQGTNSLGMIVMTEFAPSYAGQPGFKENVATEWLASDAESAGGGVATVTNVGGRTVYTMVAPDGTTAWVFWTGNIMVAVYGTDQASMQPFVTAFLTGSPA